MVQVVKNQKTKLPPLRINIRFGLMLVAIAAVIGELYAYGAVIYIILGIYLGYRILRFVMRLIGLIISVFYIAILVLIITFLII
jgi:hypothetical protein